MKRERFNAFRTSMGGYKKSDVFDYIKALNDDFSAKSDELLSRAEAAEDECERLSPFEAKANEYETLCASLAAEQEELKNKYKELEDKYNRLLEYTSDYEFLRQKALQYDIICDKLNECTENARNTSKEILSSARNAADKILADTENETGRILRETGDAAYSSVNNIAQTVNVMVDSTVNEILSYMKEAQRYVDTMISSMESRTSLLSKKVSEYALKSGKTVNEELDKLKNGPLLNLNDKNG